MMDYGGRIPNAIDYSFIFMTFAGFEIEDTDIKLPRYQSSYEKFGMSWFSVSPFPFPSFYLLLTFNLPDIRRRVGSYTSTMSFK
jgi:hypothetical protein